MLIKSVLLCAISGDNRGQQSNPGFEVCYVNPIRNAACTELDRLPTWHHIIIPYQYRSVTIVLICCN